MGNFLSCGGGRGRGRGRRGGADESNKEEESEEIEQVDEVQTFYCKICMETKYSIECFTVTGCSHVFCFDCIRGHISASTIQINVATVLCPEVNCNSVLKIESCRRILPQDVFNRWATILCESSVPIHLRFYCPFKDCSALLLDDDDDRPEGESSTVIAKTKCPHCKRFFCARCKVPWHLNMDCHKFMKLKDGEREREDLMLMELADKMKWNRCPKCGFVVEKIDGCRFVKCRCHSSFCHTCGTQVIKDHYCAKCKEEY